ncbi:MAG: hypothetical protein DBP02_03700 [gamma proteobacterium symbiont of Ctena orbiculata]|nr:MAG: hypothetical protein DBP02_03700 [gamma proteobacterium symbiont of Ctena orbiculata]
MSDEQRRVAHFQAQPEGLGLFFHPAALSFAHLARLNLAHSALLGKKTAPAESIGLVLTGPSAPNYHSIPRSSRYTRSV